MQISPLSLGGMIAMAAMPVAGESVRPLVGVTRWDMYGGHPYTTQKQEMEFLKPPEYHWRAPFFFRRTGDPDAPLAFNPSWDREPIRQATEQEIVFAASAGIDYWAFGHHGRHKPYQTALRDALDAYLQSPLKAEIGFCLIANVSTMGDKAFYEPPGTTHTDAEVTADWRLYVEEYVEMMREPTYQRVVGARPLLYLYQPGRFGHGSLAAGGKDAPDYGRLSAAIGILRSRLREADVGNPYVVGMLGGSDEPAELMQRGLVDAVSLYHYRYGGKPELPYAELWPAVERHVLNGRLGGPGLQVIPPLMSGANWLPRWRVMPQIFPPWNWGEPQPGELGRHIAAGLDYVSTHPDRCGASSVIIYAWNEHSEGGFICPTMGEPPDYRPVTRQVDEVSRALKNWTSPGSREVEGTVLANFSCGDRDPSPASVHDDARLVVSPLQLPRRAEFARVNNPGTGRRGCAIQYRAGDGEPEAFVFTIRPADAGSRLDLRRLEVAAQSVSKGSGAAVSVSAGVTEVGTARIEGGDWARLAFALPPHLRAAADEVVVRLLVSGSGAGAVRLDDLRLRGHVRTRE